MTESPTPTAAEKSSSEPMPDLFDWVKPYIKRSRRYRGAWLVLGILTLIIATAVLWAAWFVAIPEVVHWGFKPLSLKALLAAVAIVFLSVIPLWLFVPGFTMISQAARAQLDSLDVEINQKLDDIREEQKTVEEQLSELEDVDATGLMQLVRYSRLQLEAYYTIGLRQTQQSFRNSVVAMWLGFLIILVGILRYLIPLNDFIRLPVAPTEDFSTLTLAAGGIVEVISALFLWVYKSSIEQLTYFYDRQMHLHGILLSHKIASSMKDPDDTRQLIVADILAKAWRPDRTGLPTADKLKDLLKPKEAKK